MPFFVFDATDKHGRTYRDQVKSADEDEARTALQDMGFTVTRMRKKKLKSFVEKILHPRKWETVESSGNNE